MAELSGMVFCPTCWAALPLRSCRKNIPATAGAPVVPTWGIPSGELSKITNWKDPPFSS